MNKDVVVGVILGSYSDEPTSAYTKETLKELGISYECRVVSAHRAPEIMFDYARSAKDRGLKVIIALAGGAAHLPGMVAALTTLPVIGVPIESSVLHGIDSALSMLQMPAGTPVATVAIGKAGAVNAALLAASILGYYEQLVSYRKQREPR